MKTLVKFVHRKTGRYKGRRVGVVMAFPGNDGEVRYGYSLCNMKSGDCFNRDFGLNLAESRGMTVNELAKRTLLNEIPATVRRDLGKMVIRAESYYHTI